jgi:hypothetical protein
LFPISILTVMHYSVFEGIQEGKVAGRVVLDMKK